MRRSLIAIAVGLSLVLTACTQKPVGPATANRLVQPVVLSTADTQKTLSAAGITTVTDESAVNSGWQITQWQLGNLQQELANHGGIEGADLDAALPMGADAPTMAELVSAWLVAQADPIAKSAASVMGTQNWKQADQIVFPQLVFLLFVADAVQYADKAAAESTPVPVESPSVWHARVFAHRATNVQLADVVSKPCSTVANFIDSVLTQIFNAFKLDPATVAGFVSGTLGGGVVGTVAGVLAGFAASFWNHLVDVAETTTKAIIGALTAPVLNVIRAALGGLATITMIASYLKTWTAKVTDDPIENRFSIGSESDRQGTMTVSVDANQETEEWPEQLKDCAQAAGVPLPTLTKAGLPVNWSWNGTEPGLIDASTTTTTLDSQLRSTFSYVTGHEDAQTAKGQLVTPQVTVTARVRRTEVDDLRTFVTAFATAQLPKILVPVVGPMIAHYVELATQKLDLITAVVGTSQLTVSHHLRNQPTPTPSQSACIDGTKSIPAGTYATPLKAVIKLTLNAPYNAVSGGSTTTMTGSLKLSSDGSTVKGTMTLAGSGGGTVDNQVFSLGVSSDGTLTGAISGPASAPTVRGTTGGTASNDLSGTQQVSAPVSAGLHVTRIGCDSISGDLVAFFRDLEKAAAAYVTISGSGTWTAKRQ